MVGDHLLSEGVLSLQGTFQMDFEAYMGSSYRLPTQGAGEFMHPLSSEFVYPESMLSHLDPSFVNHTQPAAANMSSQFLPKDIGRGVSINNPYLATSVEKSTMTNNSHPASRLQDGSLMHSSNYNMESYLNLPSSSLTHNSLGLTDSLGLDHLLTNQQLSQAVQGQSQQHIGHQQQLSILSPMFQSRLLANHVAVPPIMKLDDTTQLQKKPRLDPNKDDIFLRHMIQQLLLCESSEQCPSHDSKPVVSARQYQMLNALQNETSLSQPLPTKPDYLQSVTRQPMKQCQKQVPEVQQSRSTCVDRLMQYLRYQEHRPKQNSITFWRKFVAEFYASDAKQRWCLSKYDNAGCYGSFFQAAIDSWKCDLCETESGRGFEARYEVLPRLCKLNFDSGVTERLLYLDFPSESKLPLGHTMLLYTKAVQETVYKNSRVVHEGQLRVVFTKELKIMSWEFCARHHEELVPRGLIEPQVNQLIQAANKYQDVVGGRKSEGDIRNGLQAIHNRLSKAGQQLERTLDSETVSDLGLSKPVVRLFQIADVINSMKDLMTYGRDNNLSPIESLNRYAADFMKSKQNNSAQNQAGGSIFSDIRAEEALNTSADTNYYQRLALAASTQNHPQETNFGAQTGRDATEPSNPYQKLLAIARNCPSSSAAASMMTKPGPPQGIILRDAAPSNPSGSLSTAPFSQGDQDPRKYVLNKLMIDRIFNGGPPQLQPAPPLPMQAESSKRGNGPMQKAGGGSKTKGTTGKRAPRKGSRASPSMNRSQPSSVLTGVSSVSVKKEVESLEEEIGVPVLPGVQVKKEVFYG